MSKGKRKEIIHLDAEFQQGHNQNPHVPELEDNMEGCDSSDPDAGKFQYNKDRMIHEFAKFLNLKNLPLKSCECDDFEELVQNALQPAFEKPRLGEMVKTIVAEYREEKRVLRQYFDYFNGGVAVSADLWTSEWGECFVCVICHWIDESWIMQNRILGFLVVCDDAISLGICAEIITWLAAFKLNPKISRISLGNPFNNYECVDFVTSELKPALGDLFTYDRSCAYVVDLCAQQGMEQLDLLINPVRELIRWIRVAYRDYKHVFNNMCKEVGLKPGKNFRLDWRKKWKSTYEMLSIVFPYREILTKLYKDHGDECRCLGIQWDSIDSIIGLFKKFDDAIHTLSSVYEPSCHLAIQECICIVQGLKTYENDPFLCLVVRNIRNKWVEHLSDIPTIHCIASILDPRVKLEGLSCLLEFYYETLGVAGLVCFEEKLSKCSDILWRAYAHYESQMVVTSKKNKGTDSSSSRSKLLLQVLKKKKIGPQVKNEYDEYLYFQHLIPNPNDFEILQWWKAKAELFPILSKVAKDILCTPSSTLAFEYVYSAGKGKRVLDEQWAILQPSQIQACICKRDWNLAEKRAQDLHHKQVDDDDDDDDDVDVDDVDDDNDDDDPVDDV